jgi:hypothetical protein
MRTQTLLFLLIAAGILGFSEFLVIVNTIPPHTADQNVFWAFFVSLFIGLTGILSLGWYVLKRYLVHRGGPISLLGAVRQAGLVSLIIVLSLFFKSLGILSLWEFVPLCISALLIEFFFQAEKSPAPISQN